MVQAPTVSPPKVVRIIEPTIPIHETVKTTYRALRVAAYCRVSTKQEEQLHSYETQVKHYFPIFLQLLDSFIIHQGVLYFNVYFLGIISYKKDPVRKAELTANLTGLSLYLKPAHSTCVKYLPKIVMTIRIIR